MWEWIGVVGWVILPVKGAGCKSWWAVGDELRLVLLGYGEVGMEARGDGHGFVTVVFHCERVGECPFARSDGGAKGELVRIVCAGGIAAFELHTQMGALLFYAGPGKVTTEAMYGEGGSFVFEDAIFEPGKVGDHQWQSPTF